MNELEDGSVEFIQDASHRKKEMGSIRNNLKQMMNREKRSNIISNQCSRRIVKQS